MSTEERKEHIGSSGRALSIPQVLYQNVDLEISLEEERILGSTTMWLGFSENLSADITFSLHSRVGVKTVTVNGVPARWDVRDPLDCLSYDKGRRSKYDAQELDGTYRAALEIAREGEMRVSLPSCTGGNHASGEEKKGEKGAYILPSLQPAPPLPLGAPSDVRTAYERLEELLWAVRT